MGFELCPHLSEGPSWKGLYGEITVPLLPSLGVSPLSLLVPNTICHFQEGNLTSFACIPLCSHFLAHNV